MDVFNGQSVAASNLLAQVSNDDKFTETDIPCTARVTVDDAFFKSMYRGTSLPVPYMEILGHIDSVYIEDPNRYFPCGTNEMRFMQGQSQDVVVRYFLSNQEITDLVSMGLYDAGFKPPANLINNVFEVPVEVTYKGIYETPCCIVEIQNAQELDTTTHDSFVNGREIEGNGYEGIFFACEKIEGITPDTVYGFDSFGHNAYERHKHIETPEYKSVEEQNEVTVEPELSAEELAEIKHIKAVEEQISAEASEHATKISNVDKSNVRAFLQEVKETVKAEDEANAFDDQYASMWSDYDTTNTEQNVSEPARLSASYDLLRDMAKTKAKAEYDAKKSADAARLVDVAQDNMALNMDANADTSGFGVTDAQLQEKKDEKSGKKAAQVAHNVDVALDNMALNKDANADTSGFGASDNQHKTTAASDLLASLLKPNNGGPNGPSL